MDGDSRLPVAAPVRDVDDPAGPLGSGVTDVNFRVVKRSHAEQLRFAKRIEWVATGIGSLIGAALVIALAYYLKGH